MSKVEAELLVYEKNRMPDLVEVDPFVFRHRIGLEQWENHFVVVVLVVVVSSDSPYLN